MELMKKILFIFIIISLFHYFIVNTAYAACQINLAKPANLSNESEITLSYVTLDTQDSAGLSKIEFYYRKDGASNQTQTVNTPNPSGETVIHLDGQGKYFFSAQAFYDNGESCTAPENSTSIDTTGPAPLASFGFSRKDGSSTKYEICFKAPGDSDVFKVKIYRSDTEEFTADSDSEVHSEDISPNGQNCWINDNLDSGKDYYYAGRVIDKAGNASDPSYYNKTKTETIVINPTPGAGGQVAGQEAQNVVTNEGSILGEETKATLTPSSEKEKKPTETPKGKVLPAVDQVLPKSKSGQIILIINGILIIAAIIYFLLKRNRS